MVVSILHSKEYLEGKVTSINKTYEKQSINLATQANKMRYPQIKK
jgi:hypothetical protein